MVSPGCCCCHMTDRCFIMGPFLTLLRAKMMGLYITMPDPWNCTSKDQVGKSTIFVTAESTFTVRDLKKEISDPDDDDDDCHEVGPPIELQRLSFNGKVLEDDTKLLSHYGVVDLSNLNLEVGKYFSVKGEVFVPLTHKVSDTVQLMRDHLSLGLEGRQLQPGESMSGIKNRATLELRIPKN